MRELWNYLIVFICGIFRCPHSGNKLFLPCICIHNHRFQVSFLGSQLCEDKYIISVLDVVSFSIIVDWCGK